jgi:hypothetical protein
MTYTDEQRAIIRRIGEISARIDAVEAEHAAMQAAMGQSILNMGANLIAAIEHANRLGALRRQYGDAFREFLDTL